MGKAPIIRALGEERLLLPEQAAAAGDANDRVKYLLTLLQTARSAADGANGQPSLEAERIASGIEDGRFGGVVAAAEREPDGRYRIPGAAALTQRALRETGTMLEPLATAGLRSAEPLRARLAALETALDVEGDRISAEDVERLCAPPSPGLDTLHGVVLDAHRELNALRASLGGESVDGASAYALQPQDRPLLAAFMNGLHATEALRLDHPGLGTLATRSDQALVLQNDLGETDAHVVVVRIAGLTVTITYTDVHLQRLLFFQQLLAWPGLVWEDTRSRRDRSVEGSIFHLASGRLEARDRRELESFLELVGSRLVFLIDWNRARKRLRRLVGRRAALDLLTWAAEERYGHLAFLRAGGDTLVYDALQFAAGRLARPGETLQDMLGPEAASSALRGVLRICSVGLRDGKPVSLVQDEVRAELMGYMRSARQELLELALRHAEVSVEIAETAGDALEHSILGNAAAREAAAQRARRDEHDADGLVREARAAASRVPELSPVLVLLEAADDIADSAEEAAFYATLLPIEWPAGELRAQLRRMSELVLQASRAYLRAVGLSSELSRAGPESDIDAFLAAVHEAIALEHETDEAQRDVHRALAAMAPEAASTFAVIELTRAYEEAADALMHAAHLLREQALARVSGTEAPRRRAPKPSAPAQPSRQDVEDELYVIGGTPGPIPARESIGGKALGLARLERAGVPVPDAVVLRTSACSRVGQDSARPLRELLRRAVGELEARTGLRFGSPRSPLVLSVRSGAPVSMPGMLETVLDVGLCEVTVRGLELASGNPRLAWDSYRRFVESYASVVHGCPREPFDAAVARAVRNAGVAVASELGSAALERLARSHAELFASLTGTPIPQDPSEQLDAAVRAVIGSWDAPKAREYRRARAIPERPGTAVILQRMVYGNYGGVSGAGVGFTRDPAVGEHEMYLDFMIGAQGDDVVGGREDAYGTGDLARRAPELLERLRDLAPRLEAELGDVQEFEFTVQDGELFVLQARDAKRTPWAALRIATDQVREGLIDRRTALQRLDALDLASLRRARVDPSAAGSAIAHATPAGVGVATGPLAMDAEAAERLAAGGAEPVLVRPEAATGDLAALRVSAGLLTAAGSRTSHAAVVARELGKPCLVGCEELELEPVAHVARFAGTPVREGEVISIDAETGLVFAGAPRIVEERPGRELAEVEAWRSAPRAGPASVP